MTRKCALCKETNYKNNYSFFSAPKDPETRKKWQIALAIENYAVTDDTYVCSKHFHRNDIITHWVSGVPPQEIKIKYKKCRLRPGAVPGRNFHSINDSQSVDQDATNNCDVDMNDFLTFKKKQSLDSLEDNETFLIPRRENSLSDNEYMENRNINTRYQTYSKLQNCIYNSEKKYESDNVRLSEETDRGRMNVSRDSESQESRSKRKESHLVACDNNRNLNVFTETTESTDTDKEEIQIPNEPSHAENETTTHGIKRYDSSEEERTSVEMWDIASADSYLREEPVDKNLKTIDLYIENQVLNTLNFDHSYTQNRSVYTDVSENEILFEDFLEVCTEVPIPRGWSCLVTSKGHGTTVVYLYMGITKDGLPFVEKQVFLRSDMVLHCAAVNREINPLEHNLVKESKRIKVKNLLDIEELVDEFDRRIVCQGICDSRDYEDDNMIRVAYKDGIKWRHTACPLIMNSDSSKCTKCATLSRALMRKSRKSVPFSYELAREYPLRRIQKRIGECDRPCIDRKCIKTFRK